MYVAEKTCLPYRFLIATCYVAISYNAAITAASPVWELDISAAFIHTYYEINTKVSTLALRESNDSVY
jgi:hypothetical protein